MFDRTLDFEVRGVPKEVVDFEVRGVLKEVARKHAARAQRMSDMNEHNGER